MPLQRTTLTVLAFSLAIFPALGGIANADGPGGSSEHHGQCTNAETDETTVLGPGTTAEDCPDGTTGETIYDNQVTCGENVDLAGLDVFVGPGGVEVCNDDEDLPLQGRVMVSGDVDSRSGFAGADGDGDNPFPTENWVGVSSEAGTPVACGERSPTFDPNGVAPVTSAGLDHAGEDDDVSDCAFN